MSEREFQIERLGQWTKGKSADTFCPIGPWLVTADEVPDPGKLALWTEVNGERRQNSNTADLIFGVDHIVSYVSHFMTLLPGDVIPTGTPSGVGMGFKPPKFLKPGDRMRLSVEGLGEQNQRLVAFSEIGCPPSGPAKTWRRMRPEHGWRGVIGFELRFRRSQAGSIQLTHRGTMYERRPGFFREDTLPGRRVEAKVKWFNASKGFGFVTPSDGSQDAFLPMAVLRRAGYEDVREGASVSCEVSDGAKGPLVTTVLNIDNSTATGPSAGAGGFRAARAAGVDDARRRGEMVRAGKRLRLHLA